MTRTRTKRLRPALAALSLAALAAPSGARAVIPADYPNCMLAAARAAPTAPGLQISDVDVFAMDNKHAVRVKAAIGRAQFDFWFDCQDKKGGGIEVVASPDNPR